MTPHHSVPFVLLALVGACSGIEALLLLADLGVLPYPGLRMTVYFHAAFWTGLLDDLQPNYASQPYLMFLSYAFLHSGVVHLVVNMFTLFSLGRVICTRVGARGFTMIYAVAVIGGAIGFALLTGSRAPMVGASGGLFGLVGAILAWSISERRDAQESLWPVWRVMLGLLMLNLLLWWFTSGLLAWETHLGGFAAGWLMALAIRPDPEDIADDA